MLPKELFESEEFAKLALGLEEKFVASAGLDSELCFISEDSLTKLSERALSEADLIESDLTLFEMDVWPDDFVIPVTLNQEFFNPPIDQCTFILYLN